MGAIVVFGAVLGGLVGWFFFDSFLGGAIVGATVGGLLAALSDK